jgi:hypothetical protein
MDLEFEELNGGIEEFDAGLEVELELLLELEAGLVVVLELPFELLAGLEPELEALEALVELEPADPELEVEVFF